MSCRPLRINVGPPSCCYVPAQGKMSRSENYIFVRKQKMIIHNFWDAKKSRVVNLCCKKWFQLFFDQKKRHSQCSNPQTSHEPRRSCLGFLGLGDSTLASIADLSLGFSGSSTLWKNGFLRRRHCWEKKRVWNLRVYLQNDNHIRKWLMWLISGMYLGDKATKEHPHKQSNAPGRGTFSLWSSTNSSL